MCPLNLIHAVYLQPKPCARFWMILGEFRPVHPVKHSKRFLIYSSKVTWILCNIRYCNPFLVKACGSLWMEQSIDFPENALLHLKTGICYWNIHIHIVCQNAGQPHQNDQLCVTSDDSIVTWSRMSWMSAIWFLRYWQNSVQIPLFYILALTNSSYL